MGLAAGLQTLRSRRMPDFEDPNETKSFVHDIFPTGMAFMALALCASLTLIVLGGAGGGGLIKTLP